jgi:hypothetical protein
VRLRTIGEIDAVVTEVRKSTLPERNLLLGSGSFWERSLTESILNFFIEGFEMTNDLF